MYLEDLCLDESIPSSKREAVRDFAERKGVGLYIKVLVPSDSNDDVNGSQHVSNGGTDFTYRDADSDDVVNGSALGFYPYFRKFYSGYTGHSYEGEGEFFSAIVVDPPAYAVDEAF